MKRSGKFYRKNEAEVMRMLGLRPTKNSGSGWVEKEDGISDDVICQLKSTDAQSIKVSKKDLDTLNYNASVAHKLPVFAIQFIGSDEVYLLIKPDTLCDVAKYIETGEYAGGLSDFIGVELNELEDETTVARTVVRSSSRARERFNEENEKKFKKERKSAK